MRSPFVIIALLGSVLFGCNDRHAAESERKAPIPLTTRNEVTITHAEYGDSWPFTVESGVLKGKPTGNTLSDGSNLAEVTFTAKDKTYYINGVAEGSHRYADLQEIWAEDSSAPRATGF